MDKQQLAVQRISHSLETRPDEWKHLRVSETTDRLTFRKVSVEFKAPDICNITVDGREVRMDSSSKYAIYQAAQKCLLHKYNELMEIEEEINELLNKY